MANVSNQSLNVQNLNATTVRVTVTYRLTPTQAERLSGSVFRENIRLIGDDAGDVNDIVITTFPEALFQVSNSTPFVDRSRIINVLKSAMNEDPAFLATGAEQTDEAVARIALSYAGNPPIPPTAPAPLSTGPVSGAWK